MARVAHDVQRRGVLLGTTALLAGLTGCSFNQGSSSAESPSDSEPPTDTPVTTGTPTESPTTTKEPQDARIELRNRTDTDETVRITITSDGETYFDQAVALPGDEFVTVYTEITPEGNYAVRVVVDAARTGSWTWDVSDFELTAGRRMIINVFADRLAVMVEQ